MHPDCNASSHRARRARLEGGVDLAALRGAGARQVVRVVVAEREEALQARAGVVGALPVVPVRQRDYQPRLLAPPLLACKTTRER